MLGISRAHTPRLLLAFGCACAIALMAAATLGFGDARETAELRARREADATARALAADWRRATRGEAVPADGVVEQREIGVVAAPEFAPIEPLVERGPGSPANLGLLASRIAARDGRLRDAIDRARDVAAASEAAVGEALLAIVHAHLQCDAREQLASDFEAFADGVPFAATVEGLCARVVALLSAGPALEQATIDAQLERCAAALQRGEVALPAPRDVAFVDVGGFTFEMDEGWNVLAALAEERAPSPGWGQVLRVEERRDLAILAAWGDGLDERWRATSLEGGAWLLARAGRSGGGHFAVADHAALDRWLATMLPAGSEFVVQAFAGSEPSVALSQPIELVGTPVTLTLGHRDPTVLIDPYVRRAVWLRWGLVILAGLLLASSIAGARALRRAARLDALRTTFVASVSHDLRTPIASIGLLAENMANGYAEDREGHYVDTIRRESDRLKRLVDDLLDFGRLERGLPPRMRPLNIDPQQWLDGFETRERLRCREAECALSVERVHLPASVCIDTAALERALSNLIDNALRHGGASEVTMRVEGTLDGALQFDVIDDGVGLSRAALRKDLFRPFQREGDGAGTGLGLSIVRAIARAHGGDATLHSRDDERGTRARLTAETLGEDAA